MKKNATFTLLRLGEKVGKKQIYESVTEGLSGFIYPASADLTLAYEDVYAQLYRMNVDMNVDLLEGDRITDVVYLGQSMTGEWSVKNVVIQPGVRLAHKECLIFKPRG